MTTKNINPKRLIAISDEVMGTSAVPKNVHLKPEIK
jgi:hypothetical protein